MNKTEFPLVFFGSGKIGVMCLDFLLKHKVYVPLVVARFDDTGKSRTFISLKEYALRKKCNVVQTKKIDKKFIEYLKKINYKWLLSVQYDKILPKDVLSAIEYKVNMHFSFLPKCRGCFPIPWAITENHSAGVTLHEITARVDSGGIIAQKRIKINSQDTAKTVYANAEKVGFDLFRKNFLKIFPGGYNNLKQQKELNSTYHPSGYPFDRVINWGWPANKIDRFVRGLTFPPFPGARTYVMGAEIGILNPIKLVKNKPKVGRAGEIIRISDHSFLISTKNFPVLIKNVSLNGQKIKISNLIKRFNLKEHNVLG